MFRVLAKAIEGVSFATDIAKIIHNFSCQYLSYCKRFQEFPLFFKANLRKALWCSLESYFWKNVDKKVEKSQNKKNLNQEGFHVVKLWSGAAKRFCRRFRVFPCWFRAVKIKVAPRSLSDCERVSREIFCLIKRSSRKKKKDHSWSTFTPPLVHSVLI